MLVDFIKGALLSLCLKASGSVFAFLFSLALARNLGASDTGIYYLAVTIITVIVTISRLGLDTTITRFSSTYHSRTEWPKINSLYKLSMFVVLTTSSFLCLLTAVFSEFIATSIFNQPSLSQPLFIIALSGPFFSVYWLHSHFFQGIKNIIGFQIFQYAGLSCLMFIGLLVAKYILGYVDLDAEFAVKLYLLNSLILAVIALIFWLKKSKTTINRDPFTNVNEIYLSARPLFGVALLGLIINFFGPLALGYFSSPSDVGIYNIALRVATLCSLVLAATNGFVFPKFAAYYAKGDKAGLTKISIISTRFMLLLCIPFIVPMLVFPSFILQQFGHEFVEGKWILITLALAQLFNVATGSVGGLLNMSGNENATLRINVISAIIIVSTSLIFIPIWGAIGAAFASAFGIVVQMTLMTLKVKKVLGFTPMNIFAKTS
jgi:O-antigen/teichoic acid export membrane protein